MCSHLTFKLPAVWHSQVIKTRLIADLMHLVGVIPCDQQQYNVNAEADRQARLTGLPAAIAKSSKSAGRGGSSSRKSSACRKSSHKQGSSFYMVAAGRASTSGSSPNKDTVEPGQASYFPNSSSSNKGGSSLGHCESTGRDKQKDTAPIRGDGASAKITRDCSSSSLTTGARINQGEGSRRDRKAAILSILGQEGAGRDPPVSKAVAAAAEAAAAVRNVREVQQLNLGLLGAAAPELLPDVIRETEAEGGRAASTGWIKVFPAPNPAVLAKRLALFETPRLNNAMVACFYQQQRCKGA